MKKFPIFFFIILSVFLHYSLSFAAKKALLVGVANYQNLPANLNGRKLTNLKGPENDVKVIKNCLLSYYGFSDDEIRVLTNDNATKEKIETNFNEWLVKGSKTGDLVVFYFSGHGSTVPDYNGDEDDGKDEVLLPYDMVPNGGYNIVVDDEFGMWLNKLNGRTVVAIVDSCYSGGVVRGIGKEIKNLDETPARMEKFIPITNYQPSPVVRSLSKGSPDVPNSVIFMAASREDESALEVVMPKGFQGGFTFGLSEGMKNLRNVSYDSLFEYAKKMLKDQLQLPQEPQIEPKGILIAKEAFGIAGPTISHNPPAQEQAHQTAETQSWIKGAHVLLKIDTITGINRSDMTEIEGRIKGLPYVEIAGNEFFDRMLRGEFRNGRYHIQLLNRIGDVDDIKVTDTIADLINSIKPKLEYVYMVKQLAYISRPDSPLKVKLDTIENKRDFRLGEEVVFNIYSENDIYLLMLNLDSQGNCHIIFPNKFYPNNKVSGGKNLTIPDENMKKNDFRFEFGEPAGEETVKVIASTTPLRLEDIGLGKFEERFDPIGRIAVPETKRDTFVKKISEKLFSDKFIWNEDTIVIRSHVNE